MRIMKKLIAIILTMLMMVAVAGCQAKTEPKDNGSKPNTEETSDKSAETPESGEKTAVDAIKEAGKLVMATSADYPPFETISDDGKEIIGFDVDIAKAVADKLGVELEVKNIDFDGLLETLKQGKADIVASGMSVDEERLLSVDFSKVYFTDEQRLIVKEGNEDIKTAADMKGKTIGAQLGTTCESAAKSIEGVNVKSMDKADLILLDVQSGRLDGAVINLAVAANYMANMGGLKMVDIPELNVNPEGYAIAVKKGNTDLAEFINGVIDELQSSGEYDKLLEKWDLNDK